MTVLAGEILQVSLGEPVGQVVVGAAGFTVVPITQGTLNPVSVGFVSLAPGQLQYNGPDALFSVSYEANLGQLQGALVTYITALLLNGVPVGQSYWFENNVTSGIFVGLYGQALLQLKAGDILQIGVNHSAVGDLITILVRSLTIVAK